MKELFEKLKEHIALDNFDLAMEVAEELENEWIDKKDIVKAKDERISELETMLEEESENLDWQTFVTPLGNIRICNEKGNLKLQEHIDALLRRLEYSTGSAREISYAD